MGKIQVLDKSVSNKIAAGEVVERPASVVKELLENALDAGATHIVTEIKNGGITYIRVADNGCGMSREEVPLSLLRHATSKISEAKDLEAISTLGFRGEALSSIVAVSRMEIYTKSREEELGTYLAAADGEVTECREAGCPQGTTIVVRDLFSTTPARMKFLKKNYTEAGYISDIINRLALARADVSFRLIVDGKESLFTAGDGDLLRCIFAVYGKELKNTMLPAFYEEGGVRVEGFCATAQGARPNRSMENFFVNGRYIKSPLLARAAEEAYKNELMGGKFPACVVLVTLPPSLVDINVHPTKLEAKFADEKSIYHCVYWAVKNGLYQKQAPQAVTLEAEEKKTERPMNPFKRERIAGGVKSVPVMRETERKEVSFSFPARPVVTAEQSRVEEKEKGTTEPKATPEREVFQRLETIETRVPSCQPSSEPVKQKEAPAPRTTPVMETKTEPEEEKKPMIPPYRICGQVFNTYIIVEQDNRMLLVDQHAAHERLRYEELLLRFANRQVQSQQLLVPLQIRLTSTEESLFYEQQDMLFQMGFDAEPFGDKTALLRGTPEALDDESIKAMFLEVLGNLGEQKKDAAAEKVQRALYTIACKSAVKAGNKLSEQEMKVLLDAVFSLGSINTCPHGRPITVAMTRGFIEKQFKRVL